MLAAMTMAVMIGCCTMSETRYSPVTRLESVPSRRGPSLTHIWRAYHRISNQAVDQRPKDHRKCVGIVLLNSKDEAFVACRSDLTVATKVKWVSISSMRSTRLSRTKGRGVSSVVMQEELGLSGITCSRVPPAHSGR